MRPVALVAFDDFDEARFLQHLQMAAEIAVGERAKRLEIGKRQALGMRYQRGQQAKPRLLVNDAIETVIGKWRSVVISVRHRFPRMQCAEEPPSAIGRSRRASPSSMATACD